MQVRRVMAEAGFVPPPGSYVWGSLMVATGKAGDGAGAALTSE
jgi:hypothetical protein